MEPSREASLEEIQGNFPVVGVGASAGGLEAFQELIANIRPDHGCAWVLAQHLDPDHSSLLPELLSRRSSVPVRVISDGMALEAGSLHLIPPGAELTVIGRKLHLVSFDAPRGLRRPIDVFFESLAADIGNDCAAVILSGTGSDGTLGIRAVKEAGGLVFVQDPKQAKYDGMPKSAIGTHAVDLVLPAGDMATVLEEYFDRRLDLEPKIENDAHFVDRVTKHIRYRTGHDFSHYKKATLLRRLARRMSVLGIHSPTSYLQRIIVDPLEAPQIFRDILINVTSFFRDAESFDVLQKIALSELVKVKQDSGEIRVWVPGCSSGQEAYSIAILLYEELQRSNVRSKVAIFATDIDPEALTVAREGIFPNSIATEMPRHLLERHFTTTPQGYRISPAIRDMVRVSQQNVIKDPPFSKLDLISCRNVLIYFDAQLQERVFQIFQYALSSGGFLLLGQSENVAAGSDAFESISKSERLYRRRPGPSRGMNLPLHTSQALSDVTEALSAPFSEPSIPADIYERAVLASHAPPYVVVNSRRQIVYASARTGKYLELPGGRASFSLFDMVDPGLKPALRGILASIGDEHGDIRIREVRHHGRRGPRTAADGGATR
ncbi:MAG: CheR family methyltransferase [Hyphomicrobiaceae bacterium]